MGSDLVGYERYDIEYREKVSLIILGMGMMFSYGRVRYVLELRNSKLYVPGLGHGAGVSSNER